MFLSLCYVALRWVLQLAVMRVRSSDFKDLLYGLTVAAGLSVSAQNGQPPAYPPTPAEQRNINTRLADLSSRLASLAARKIDPTLIADADVYRKAAEYVTRFPEEFFGKNYPAETLKVLDTGLARAKELEAGAPSWPVRTGHVVRGYVSRVDGSTQPYGLTIPTSYDGSKPIRLDVWLHGTQPQLNEVRFITQQEGDHETSQVLMQDYIQLEPFGRMNLSYRYGGENDAQLRASKRILEALEKEGFHFTRESPYRWVTSDLRALFLVGPKTGHAWHPDSKKESEAFIRKALETADRTPNHLRCVTYTTRFNQCHWIVFDALEAHYERAEIDAARSDDLTKHTITTKNVARLQVAGLAAAYTIDGQTVSGPANPTFEKVNGRWKVGAAHPSGLRKVHGLQGPIDDAFLDSFVVVRGTGTSWNTDAAAYTEELLATFKSNFAKWLRGDIRIKDDRAVTANDIASSNLVLFGDPAGNRLSAKVMAKLPIQWTEREIVVGGKKFPAGSVVAMIYPNPLNPRRYVVLNSGLTFDPNRVRAGTESLFFPRLGDYAVIGLDGSVKVAGLFDENWQLK